MEHNVYICGWSNSKDGWTLWVKSRPKVRATGATYQIAEAGLIECIQDAGGAMQAVLEFDPPLRKSPLDAQFSTPELYTLCGDDRFETVHQRQSDEMFAFADQFYQSPICRDCRSAVAPRSEKALIVDYIRAEFDGAFGGIDQVLTHHRLFSGEFLALLSAKEKRALDFRKVERRKGARKEFYELVGPKGPPFVGVKGLKPNGWFCQSCGNRSFGYWVPDLAINNFVAVDDLPNPLPTAFTVGELPEVELCVTGPRWRQLVGKKGTRGLTSQLLGVVPRARLNRNPALKPLHPKARRS